MKTANYNKTFILSAVFEHSVTFKVKARSAEHAEKLVEYFGFFNDGSNYSFRDENFEGFLGVSSVEEITPDNKPL